MFTCPLSASSLSGFGVNFGISGFSRSPQNIMAEAMS